MPPIIIIFSKFEPLTLCLPFNHRSPLPKNLNHRQILHNGEHRTKIPQQNSPGTKIDLTSPTPKSKRKGKMATTSEKTNPATPQKSPSEAETQEIADTIANIAAEQEVTQPEEQPSRKTKKKGKKKVDVEASKTESSSQEKTPEQPSQETESSAAKTQAKEVEKEEEEEVEKPSEEGAKEKESAATEKEASLEPIVQCKRGREDSTPARTRASKKGKAIKEEGKTPSHGFVGPPTRGIINPKTIDFGVLG